MNLDSSSRQSSRWTEWRTSVSQNYWSRARLSRDKKISNGPITSRIIDSSTAAALNIVSPTSHLHKLHNRRWPMSGCFIWHSFLRLLICIVTTQVEEGVTLGSRSTMSAAFIVKTYQRERLSRSHSLHWRRARGHRKYVVHYFLHPFTYARDQLTSAVTVWRYTWATKNRWMWAEALK